MSYYNSSNFSSPVYSVPVEYRTVQSPNLPVPVTHHRSPDVSLVTDNMRSFW